MRSVTTPGGVRAILRQEKMRPSRRLGQVFLADRRVRDGILDAAQLVPGETVLEVGPGLGILTEGLLQRGVRVVAVERDARLARLIRQNLDHPELLVLEADALSVDLSPYTPEGGWKIVSNLPYSVTSPLLVRLLPLAARGAVLMVQAEVAERLLAPPGRRERGALTVYVEALGTLEPVFRVSRNAFVPRPLVDSEVVRFSPRKGEAPDEDFHAFVRGLFQYRRKTIGRALRHLGIDPDREGERPGAWQDWLKARPEDLTTEELRLLFRALRG